MDSVTLDLTTPITTTTKAGVGARGKLEPFWVVASDHWGHYKWYNCKARSYVSRQKFAIRDECWSACQAIHPSITGVIMEYDPVTQNWTRLHSKFPPDGFPYICRWAWLWHCQNVANRLEDWVKTVMHNALLVAASGAFG
jgi:hypothetical protein